MGEYIGRSLVVSSIFNLSWIFVEKFQSITENLSLINMTNLSVLENHWVWGEITDKFRNRSAQICKGKMGPVLDLRERGLH